MNYNIAVDVQVGLDVLASLKSKEVNVILQAREAERDEDWFYDALAIGANCFVSPDYDIAFLCNKNNVKWIQLKKGQSGDKVVQRIMSKLASGNFD